jgi:replicative DNA helicase
MMNTTIQKVILQGLVFNEGYSRRVLPFIKEEYFSENSERKVFAKIYDYINSYNKLPNKDALVISLQNDKDLSQGEYEKSQQLVGDLVCTNEDEDWLVDETEKFCKERALYNAVLESIQIIEGKSKTKTPTSLPSILSEALSVSFDTNIGHDFLKDAEKRYDYYHKIEQKIPFDIEFFNTITNGGVPQKTLNVVIAGTGVGKSLFLCHHAANCLMQNKNVLYITCEMSEERIAERIDANIMDITLDDMKHLTKQMYGKKLYNATKGVTGQLIIKEYPTATAHVNHFRHLLDELLLKKKFKPDIIFIDYLNICSSARVKASATMSSYSVIKAIAEELRGLAIERNVPVFTATQVNRSGHNNTDIGLENTSESFGLPATADLMFALIGTDELDQKNQIIVKQLKNRYNELTKNRKFVVGINRAKMKLHNVDPSEQEDLVGTGEEGDVGSSGHGENIIKKFKKKGNVNDWNI